MLVLSRCPNEGIEILGDGLRIGIDSFGASAPIDALYDHFGLTADKITAQILAKLG
jgi:transketolase